jgi:hypothetical protein
METTGRHQTAFKEPATMKISRKLQPALVSGSALAKDHPRPSRKEVDYKNNV